MIYCYVSNQNILFHKGATTPPKQSNKKKAKGPSSSASITSKRHQALPTRHHSRSTRSSRRRCPSSTRHAERRRRCWVWRYKAGHSANIICRRNNNRRRAESGRRSGVKTRRDNRGIDALVLSSNAGYRYHFLGYNVLCACDIRLGAIFEGEGAISLGVMRCRIEQVVLR